MTKIKILHIIKSLGRGGAEMLLPETLKLHDKSQFEFHYIYFLPWKNQMVDSLLASEGLVTCISANNNFQLMLTLRKVMAYIEKHNIDIIHAHLPWAGIASRVIGRFIRIPVIYTEHNKQERYHWITKAVNLLTINWLTRIIAVSEDVASSIEYNKPNLKPQLEIVLNGVNVSQFSPDKFAGDGIRKALNIPVQSFVIGTIAVFRSQKRLDLWLDLASKILGKIPGTHFIIVGDGPLGAELRKKVSDIGIGGNVHFPGMQTEIRPFIAAFDVYMMSSIFEGLPIALLETMASGCPVISTNAGGIKEVIRHGVDGMLCAVDDPDALTEFASILWQSPEKRKMLAQSARKRVEESFSIDTMVKKLEALYLDLKTDK